MRKGVSLHIGLNLVDPGHYAGWTGKLMSCEADADDMEAIAKSTGFTAQKLLTKAATRENVRNAILDAARNLDAGDIFLVSYAGHGGQVPDKNGDEDDYTDETWCLYNGQLIDDELFGLWKEFKAGVRVLVFSDSCHSGTVTRDAKGELDLNAVRDELKTYGIETPRFRFMPPDEAGKTYRANKDFYDQLGENTGPGSGDPAATIRLISGCQDDQTSADGPFNGLFTGTLLRVWNKGNFEGDYSDFHSAIVNRMPTRQRPNHMVIGPADLTFDQQKPFTING